LRRERGRQRNTARAHASGPLTIQARLLHTAILQCLLVVLVEMLWVGEGQEVGADTMSCRATSTTSVAASLAHLAPRGHPGVGAGGDSCGLRAAEHNEEPCPNGVRTREVGDEVVEVAPHHAVWVGRVGGWLGEAGQALALPCGAGGGGRPGRGEGMEGSEQRRRRYREAERGENGQKKERHAGYGAHGGVDPCGWWV
jgi:hypothetical protein